MKRLSLALALMLFTALPAVAQVQGSITGTVRTNRAV